MRSLNKIVVALLAAAILAGCASRTYNYIDQSYESENAALAAQAKHFEQLAIKLAPRAAIGQTVLVLTPDMSRCEADCIIKPKGIVDVHALAYVLKLQVAQYASFARYLQHSGLYARADSKTVSDPRGVAEAAAGYDAVIYLLHDAPATEPGWHVIKSGKELGVVKLTQAAPEAMLERWLDDVTAVAK